jgi:hypothetical protein
MNVDDFLDDIDTPTLVSDGVAVVGKLPNLFRNVIVDCQNTFGSLDMLEAQGFKPVASLSSEILNVFQTDELYFDLNVTKNVYVQDFGSYKIMVVLSISQPNLEKPNLLASNNHNYYIMAKVLLDQNDNILKNIKYDLPSITFYRKESTLSGVRSKLILDSYYTFFENYYVFTDIEDFDCYTDRYSFTFREYNNNIIATSVTSNSAIELIRLKNSTFYMKGITYNPDILFDIMGIVKSSNVDFTDCLRCRMAMTPQQLDVLAMTII